jgi:hypothetical protein
MLHPVLRLFVLFALHLEVSFTLLSFIFFCTFNNFLT